MEAVSTTTLVTTLALVGTVILISALLSGFIERTGLPQVAVFLALGAVLGPYGVDVLNIRLDSPALRIVATLSLALVLFTDAVTLDLRQVRQHGGLALLVLGPGTMLTAGLIGLAGWGLLGLAPAAAAILGAALASTDPVILRGLLRLRNIPESARQALRLESGLNDVVLLPIILVAITILGTGATNHSPNWAKLGIDLFLLGPAAGVIVGLLAVATLDLLRRKVGVRRDYESLYSLGVALTAFAAAEALHGSGFLAAFAAGLTIAALDIELCDCFLEYGETTAEMALLFTFVLFGSSLIWSGLGVLGPATLLFVALVILARPASFFVSLFRSNIGRKSKLLIGWFGPRGLSSLLLILLPVFEGVPGSDTLFALCSLVVLFSIVLHGGTPIFLARSRTKSTRVPLPVVESQNGSVGSVAVGERYVLPHVQPDAVTETTAEIDDEDDRRSDPDRISIAELQQLEERGIPFMILDVRTERAYGASDEQVRDAVRLIPEHVVEQAHELGLPRDRLLVTYCA